MVYLSVQFFLGALQCVRYPLRYRFFPTVQKPDLVITPRTTINYNKELKFSRLITHVVYPADIYGIV